VNYYRMFFTVDLEGRRVIFPDSQPTESCPPDLTELRTILSCI
jgi:hypothetical protein